MEVYQILLISIVAMIGQITGDIGGGIMFNRPIVLAPIVGAILGDVQQGLIMGAALELIFLGVVSIGGSTPSDANMGSVLGTAFAISMNQGVEIALTLAVPVGLLMNVVRYLIYFFRSTTMHHVEIFAENGEFNKITWLHFGHALLYAAICGIVTFVSLQFGSGVIENFVKNIPEVIINGLSNGSKMLPAVGFALLMNMLWDKKLSVFLLFGFVLAAYLELPIIAIACIAMTIGVVMIVQDMQNKPQTAVEGIENKDEEDFFNE